MWFFKRDMALILVGCTPSNKTNRRAESPAMMPHVNAMSTINSFGM